MSCSSCCYLKANDKKEGAVSGCCYFCTKKDSYVNGSSDKCEAFEKSYRSNYECNKIFEDGEAYYNDDSDIGARLLVLFVLIILLVLANL